MHETKKITVHIADDHPTIIEGFKSLLKLYNIDIVGSSLNGKETIQWFKENKADILILDLAMPIVNGTDVLKHFYKNNKYTQKIIVVSNYFQKSFVSESFNLGASGYVGKSDASECIIEAIEEVHKGNQYTSISIKENRKINQRAVLQNEKELEENLIHNGLSDRQIEVFKMVAQNYSSEEISGKLEISKSTFRTHIGKIIEKLNLKNRIGIIRYVQQRKHY